MRGGPGGAGLDFGAGHQLVAAGRGRVDVLQRGRGGADDHRLAAEDRVRHLAAEDARVGDFEEGPGRAAVVDPGFAVAFQLARVDLLAGLRFGDRDREADQPAFVVVHLADRAAGVRPDDGVAGAGVQFLHYRFAAEDPRFALGVYFGGREDEAGRAAHRFDQRVVVTRAARLGELDVDRDRLGAGFAQAVDHFRVQPPREGPLLVEVAEGDVVDADDDDVVGPLLGAADREAGVDALQLQRPHQVGRVGDDRQRRGAEDHGQHRQFAPPAGGAGGAHGWAR